MDIPKHISHIRTNRDGEIEAYQSNEEHCRNVAILSEKFAGTFGMGYWGHVLGLLHDKGKESAAFQQYIRRSNGLPTDDTGRYENHHHAFAGGILAAKNIIGDNIIFSSPSIQKILNLLTNQIISHHTGLHDYTDMEDTLSKPFPPEIVKDNIRIDKSLLTGELQKTSILEKENLQYFHHLSRMLFSCLIDADRLDTERFVSPESFEKRGDYSAIPELSQKLDIYLQRLRHCAADTEINRIRGVVQQKCRESSSGEKGFYSLTVPTGGGKTLSSLLWAMRHAVKHSMSRIIIAIPYTSIIVQTAGLLKEIFGEDNVLEHHSNFNPDDIKNGSVREKTKLATENWDYPIIVTTNVQLFESMFSNRPSDCRKLHNIANSIIILDEVQTLPSDFLQPIVDAMKGYCKLFGVSLLLTTASQPVLEGRIKGPGPKADFYGIDRISEIIPAELALHDKLRRVRLVIDNRGRRYDEMAENISAHDKVLCIVNTRKDAKELYDRLPDEGGRLHLSRMMCPAHIGETITRIKALLKDESQTKVRVIATQLVEAGVDIDFPVVFRQETGLDSILQAAGRCNREGKNDIGHTYVFSLAAEKRIPFGSMAAANNARTNLPADSDWFAPSTMKQYFEQLYTRKETFDNCDIKHYLYKPGELCFKTASEKFRLIEDDCINIIVNWQNSIALVEKLKESGCTYSLMKQLAKFTVGIHRSDFNSLSKQGLIEEILEGIYVMMDKAQYDASTGLRLDNHWMEEILTI